MAPATATCIARGFLFLTIAGPGIAMAHAQATPDSLAPITSMGFPTRYHWYAGGLVGSDRRTQNAEVAGEGLVGVYRDLKQPSAGMLGYAVEGYAGKMAGEGDGGMRALLTIRALRLAFGEDFSFRDGSHDFIMRFEDPIFRGGFFRTGSQMRFEWLPGRHHSYYIGVTVPLFQPWAGKSRLPHFAYSVPPAGPSGATPAPRPKVERRPASAEIAAMLTRARISALRIDWLTTPLTNARTKSEFTEKVVMARRSMEARDADFPEGHTYKSEVENYHRQMGLAFAAALGVEAGNPVADSVTAQARRTLFEQVLLRSDRRFGWFRTADILQIYADASVDSFTAWVAGSSLVPVEHRADVVGVYVQLTEIAKAAFAAEHDRWHDSRLIWIPLQLGLREQDHQTQSQIDAIIEKMLAEPFTRGNAVTYLASERFPAHLIRTIRRTRDYHVLWIHDIKGGPNANEPDTISEHVVINGYLFALTRAVREFDRTGRIPTYMIFLDEWYYELANGRFWLELLQDPLIRDLHFGPKASAVEKRTKAAVEELRAAVRASPALQAEAAKRGNDWLRNLVSVHVNITNPGDPSFPGRMRARDMTLALGDDFLRDHRKMAFFDISEDDPSRGGALFTGEGIGEQYAEGAWEDRSLEVRGAGVLPLKQYAHDLLIKQGFKPEQIPLVLRPRPLASDYERKVDSLVRIGWIGRLMPVNSKTGYDDKAGSVAKAMLYTLMPAGTRIVVPDSQWSSFAWGSMLIGAALRGCQVFAIGPGLDNAPYARSAWPQFSLQYDIFSALISVSTILHAQIAAAGGGLHVGLYEGEVGTRDFEARVREFSAGLKRNRFIRDVFPFQPALYDFMEDTDRLLKAVGNVPQDTTAGNDTTIRPRLHLKSQFYASRAFVEQVLPLPAWSQILLLTLRARIAERAESIERLPTDSASFANRPNSFAQLAPLAPFLRARTPAQSDAQAIYLSLGSQNQDDRSLIENGEVLAVISGEAALAGIADYVYLVARATWLDTQADLDREQPPVSKFKHDMARWLRRLI
jgi:hypothetical protein